MARYAENPPCDKCGGPTTQIHLPSGVVVTSDPVVVYKAPDGSYRYPGDANGLSAHAYDKIGYTRVELRGWAAVRKFEKDVNTTEGSKIARKVERELECREAGMKARRSDITNGIRNGFVLPLYDHRGRQVGTKIVHLSEQGKDLMRQAMANSDRRGPKMFESGFHIDAFANDRSNRDEARGSDGRKLRD